MTKKTTIRIVAITLIAVIIVAADIVCGLFYNIITPFLNGYGFDTSNVNFENGKQVCEDIESEGIVLLKNEDDVLPLKEKKVNVFGWSSISLAYAGGGSGSSSAVKQAVSLYKALENAKIEYNTELYEAYKAYKADREEGSYWTDQYPYLNLIEPSVSYMQKYIDAAVDFSDTAIIVVTRLGGEHQDLPKTQVKWKQAEDKTKTYLDISNEESALIEAVTSKFDNVIVLVNSINTMNLTFLDDNGIKAALLVGAVGEYGSNSVVKVLTGEVNPSGRTSDTYAYDFSTAPSYVNSPNGHIMNTDTTGVKKYVGTDDTYIDYSENIYVGYRWYETADAEGFWSTKYAEEKWGVTGYNDVVQYPFGYGLSYTKFEWNIQSVQPASGSTIKSTDEITITVSVTNTGNVPGKDVVELYFGSEYNGGKVEKASKNLLSFEKTETIYPASEKSDKVVKNQIVKFTIKASDLKSYDTSGNGSYVLEKGRYDLYIAPNSHSLSDDVHSVIGEANVYYNVVADEKINTVDGKEVKNRFTGDSATDNGVSIDGTNSDANITYLTRSDFEGTFPTVKPARGKSDKFLPETAKTDKSDTTETFKQGENNGQYLYNNDELNKDLIFKLGKNYDAPEWETLLNQLSVDEMYSLCAFGGYQTNEIPSIKKPKHLDMDGPQGINSSVISSEGTEIKLTLFPSETVMGQTWNSVLLYTYGLVLGYEAGQQGVNVAGLYAPGLNIHRSPFGGRNFEYYSEDPVLSGKLAACMIEGATNNGLYVYIKHFAVNETASNGSAASIKMYTWLTEQSLREIYLKSFEIAVKEGGANAVMSAYNRIGSVWCGASYALLTEVLRGEWGFNGSVVTDAWTAGNTFYNMDAGIRAGNDFLLNSANTSFGLGNIFKDKTSATAKACMRKSAHNILYTYCNTVYRQHVYTTNPDSVNSKFAVQVSGKAAANVKATWVIWLVLLNVVAIAGIAVITVPIIKQLKNKEKY